MKKYLSQGGLEWNLKNKKGGVFKPAFFDIHL